MFSSGTRTIPAAVLRPTTKAADAAVLLAKAMTPEPMRPGWVDALRMSRSVLPHRWLTELDERLEHAAARPVIVPEAIVCDHGKAYISRTSAMDTVARLDEIPGISPEVAQVIIAEIGLDMTRFPTAEHLASWAKLSPQTVQSGTRSRGAAVGKGNPYLKGVLGTAAVVAGRTDVGVHLKVHRRVRMRMHRS